MTGGDNGEQLLRESVTTLAGSEARLEHARAHIDLVAASVARIGARRHARCCGKASTSPHGAEPRPALAIARASGWLAERPAMRGFGNRRSACASGDVAFTGYVEQLGVCFLDRAAGGDSEFVIKGGAGAVVDAHRFGRVALGGERVHQQGIAGFSQW